MSIAWSTVAFLVLLLPGFLFLVGLYLPESFTRETAPRSPLGHLAATVLIAFLVHGLLYAISWSWDVPHVRLDYLLQILQVEALNDDEFAEIVANIESQRWPIFLYILGTSLLGIVLGYETGSLFVSGPLRRFAEHGWVYDLKVEGTSNHPPGILLKLHAAASALGRALSILIPSPAMVLWKRIVKQFSQNELRTMTIAYVLTNISHEHRHIIYRGFLKAFAISKDGKPLYLVLRSAQRSYMLLDESGPRTGPGSSWTRIGGSPTARAGLPGPRLSSYLVVSGEHIVNLVFDRHVFQQTQAGLQALNAAYATSLRRAPPGTP